MANSPKVTLAKCIVCTINTISLTFSSSAGNTRSQALLDSQFFTIFLHLRIRFTNYFAINQKKTSVYVETFRYRVICTSSSSNQPINHTKSNAHQPEKIYRLFRASKSEGKKFSVRLKIAQFYRRTRHHVASGVLIIFIIRALYTRIFFYPFVTRCLFLLRSRYSVVCLLENFIWHTIRLRTRLFPLGLSCT